MGGRFQETFYHVPQRAPAAWRLAPHSSLLTEAHFISPSSSHFLHSFTCSNKLSVPKSLSQVLLLRSFTLWEVRDGKGKVGEGSCGKEVMFETGLWKTGSQQVGRWKELNEEHRETKAWRPEGHLESEICQRRQSTEFASCPGAAWVELCMQNGSKIKNVPCCVMRSINTEPLIPIYSCTFCSPFE